MILSTYNCSSSQIAIFKLSPPKIVNRYYTVDSDCRKSPVKPGFFVVCGGKKWYNINKEKKQGG